MEGFLNQQAPRHLAEFTDYEGLRRALNAVREQRDISMELLDELAGAPKGYFSKVLGPRQAKRIGMHSLAWTIGALGVKCLIVEDPEALALLQNRLTPRVKAQIRDRFSAGKSHVVTQRFLKKISKLGVAARNTKRIRAAARKAAAHKAANAARWERHRRRNAEGSGLTFPL